MNEVTYNVSGPGLERATQEAISAGKDIVIVHDQDNSGRILRIGYFMEAKDSQHKEQPTITWFDKAEIEITPIADQVAPVNQSRLEIDLEPRKEEERNLLLNLPLEPGNLLILRCLFRIRKDSVPAFVVQVELRSVKDGKEEWRPVVRYDCAHGFIHRDLIASDGHEVKEKLPTQNPSEAVILAIEEIRGHLDTWLQQLGYEQVASQVLSQPTTTEYLDKNKRTLLELLANPQAIDSVQPQTVLFARTGRVLRIR